MTDDFTRKVGDIVRSDYRTADIFRQYGINYCCAAQTSLMEACLLKNVDPEVIAAELEHVARNSRISAKICYEEWRIGFLIDYIINIHHSYLKMALPSLEQLLVSFTESHKQKYPDLSEIADILRQLAALLQRGMRREEEALFPYIKQIESMHRTNEIYANIFVRTFRKQLGNFDTENHLLNDLLLNLRSHCGNYIIPDTACAKFHVIFNKLNELHEDITQYKYLENILFTRASGLEKDLLQR